MRVNRLSIASGEDETVYFVLQDFFAESHNKETALAFVSRDVDAPCGVVSRQNGIVDRGDGCVVVLGETFPVPLVIVDVFDTGLKNIIEWEVGIVGRIMRRMHNGGVNVLGSIHLAGTLSGR
jgi:hypothetical protein